MLSKKQIQAIEQIIRSKILAFTYEALGERALTADEIADLKRVGLIKDSVRNMVGDPYTLGKIVASLPSGDARRMTMAQVLKAATKLKPLSRVEQKAIEWASEHAGQYIRGLGDDMVKEARAGIALESGAALRAVQNQVTESISNRETVSQLKTRLFHSFDDKNRDWQRVAATEINNAIQNGIYQTIWESSPKGGDQLVFKRPAGDACRHCKRLHLEEDGITPKIFKLSELRESNIGLKANDWEATVGAVHPWCQCQLSEVPDGYGFKKYHVDARGKRLSDSEYGALSESDKQKTRIEAVLEYTGAGPNATLRKSKKIVRDNQVCAY